MKDKFSMKLAQTQLYGYDIQYLHTDGKGAHQLNACHNKSNINLTKIRHINTIQNSVILKEDFLNCGHLSYSTEQ